MHKKTVLILVLLIILTFPLRAQSQQDGKLRFAVMGCAHFGVCSPEEFESAIEKIKEYNPDFVLFLGGMIDFGINEPVESLWERFRGAVNKLDIPVYDIPSDCRLTGLNMSADKASSIERYFLNMHQKRYYSFEYKDNLFIGLDSGTLKQEKGPGFESQINFLKNSVSDVSRYNNVFVFTHDSLWLDGDNAWNRVIQPLIDGKVKFVFGARKHHLDTKKSGQVTYITTGTPPCYPGIQQSKLSFFNFLIVDAKEDNASIEIVPIGTIPIENLGILRESLKEKMGSFHETLKPHLLNSYEREVFLVPDRVIETLKIKPGMDILDLGAGVGFFTFRIADALKGTGRVFATDMDPNMIEYMKDKIKEGGYRNIFPVLVNSQGVDNFYKQHSFDIILFCEAYQYLRYPEDYFRQLRQSLKKGGRIYIIHDKNIYDFTEIEIGDFGNLIKIISAKGKDFPVFRRLDKDVQYFIENRKGEHIPPKVRTKIVDNLNKMLLDRWLFYDLIDYFASKGMTAGEGEWSAQLSFILSTNQKRDIRLVKWLFVGLDAAGAFDKNINHITAAEERQLHKFNRILLCDILGTERIEALQGEYDLPVYVEKNSVISTIKRAGYQFVREYDFLPIDYFLEFKRGP